MNRGGVSVDKNNYEEKVVAEIASWQKILFDKEPTDVQILIDKWMEKSFSYLTERKREAFFAKLDKWFIYLHTFIQQSQVQHEAKQRIISSAKVFDHSVDDIEDIRVMPLHIRTYLAEQQVAKHRLYSMAQGGVSGMGGLLFLGIDIPALFAINIKAIQLIGMSYGYEMNTPYEMVVALKVFYGATLPNHLQQHAWTELIEQVKNSSKQQLFYEGNDEITNEIWFEQLMKQGLKAVVLFMLRKKLIQGIPVFGVATGATANYKLTKQVTDYAHRFYQARCLVENSK